MKSSDISVQEALLELEDAIRDSYEFQRLRFLILRERKDPEIGALKARQHALEERLAQAGRQSLPPEVLVALSQVQQELADNPVRAEMRTMEKRLERYLSPLAYALHELPGQEYEDVMGNDPRGGGIC
ncbi:MAG TPA: hypothetical protein DEA32_00760 [Firmicutes bacterium]|nr:hypothetical protein [Bacillota bacterium]